MGTYVDEMMGYNECPATAYVECLLTTVVEHLLAVGVERVAERLALVLRVHDEVVAPERAGLGHLDVAARQPAVEQRRRDGAGIEPHPVLDARVPRACPARRRWLSGPKFVR